MLASRAGIGIRFGIDMQQNVSILDVLPGSPAEESKKVGTAVHMLTVPSPLYLVKWSKFKHEVWLTSNSFPRRSFLVISSFLWMDSL